MLPLSMDSRGRRILKVDPNNDGDDLGPEGCKYTGTVVWVDGCVYGIPYNTGIPDEARRIMKCDPINGMTTLFVEKKS